MARITVKVHPRARRTRVAGKLGGAWKLELAAPPVEGEANRALVEFLAGALGVRRADLAVVRGEAGRRKTVRVAGRTAAQVAAAL